MQCSYCTAEIDPERLKRTRRYKAHARHYCSYQCVKRAHYLRNTKRKAGVLEHGPNLDSATGKGLYWELHAQKMLGGKVLALESMNQQFDIVLENGATVDVKSSKVFQRRKRRPNPLKRLEDSCSWWSFCRSETQNADYFFCIGVRDNRAEKYFLIPRAKMPRIGASIPTTAGRSKYYEFEYVPKA